MESNINQHPLFYPNIPFANFCSMRGRVRPSSRSQIFFQKICALQGIAKQFPALTEISFGNFCVLRGMTMSFHALGDFLSENLLVLRNLFLQIPCIFRFHSRCGGTQAWSKGQGLGPCVVGLRRFKWRGVVNSSTSFLRLTPRKSGLPHLQME